MNWELSQPSKTCRLCGRDFADGARYQTALFKSDNKAIAENFEELFAEMQKNPKNPLVEEGARVDFCPDCFAGQKEALQHDFNWMGRRVEKDSTPRPRRVEFSKEGLLEELKTLLAELEEPPSREEGVGPAEGQEEDEEEARLIQRGVAYLIAVMLERKRALSHQKDITSETDGTRHALYEIPKTREVVSVPYPLLTAEWIRKYQASLHLRMNWPLPEPRQAEVSENASEAPVEAAEQ